MKRVTAKMLEMLRWLAKQPNGISGLPYRKGAANTAKALDSRGLAHYWSETRWKSYVGITDAGRAVIAPENVQ